MYEIAYELYPNTKTSPFENQFRVAERKAFIKGVEYQKRQQVNSVDLAGVGGNEVAVCDGCGSNSDAGSKLFLCENCANHPFITIEN
jgi:hypothetical protein